MMILTCKDSLLLVVEHYFVTISLCFIYIFLFIYFLLQNKCVRYWPEKDTKREWGKLCLAARIEQDSADFTLRQFDLTHKDYVRLS